MAISKLGVHELTQVYQVFDDFIMHHADCFMLSLVVVNVGGRVVCQYKVPLLEVLVGHAL